MSSDLNDLEIVGKAEQFNAKPTKSWNLRLFYSLLYLHAAAIYGLYLMFTSAQRATLLFTSLVYIASGIGVTAGAHRLWSHRSYKANIPLQIILMLFQSMASQFSVKHWVKRHRLHHKYSDTDADPHNSSRGFFFSHIGWTFLPRHDEMRKRVKLVDLSDIKSNPVLEFQTKYAHLVIIGMGTVLPTLVPMIFWGETFSNAWHINITRYILNLHATFLINSAAHMYGNKPYNKNISPTQNKLVSLVICGEGFHNYHHTFPFDYRAGELGNNILNVSSVFIDLCAWIGWAYDLKTVGDDMIRAKAKNTGDGTDSWGWPKVAN